MALTSWGANSEYAKLTRVLLYRPGQEIDGYPDSAGIQHLAPISYRNLMTEYDAIISTFTSLGVAVDLIDSSPLSADDWYRYNLMYCRDLFFMTPQGAILGKMANQTRAAEPAYAARALKTAGVPLLHAVDGAGIFEGADALWLREDLALVGVGHRTNQAGYEQVAAVLREQQVTCLSIPSYQTKTQHLLGTVQIVDQNLALVRHEITDPAVIRLLQEQGLTVVNIPERNEVLTQQAMNIVTIAPRTIIMTTGCPETRTQLENSGLTVAAELDLTQLMRGAGGLACATGIVARG
jgi:N-dimethylarginine dimethylaminohydrolase